MPDLLDVRLPDGRTVRAHDSGPGDGAARVVVWHHGSPQSGRLLQPLLDAAAPRGIRLVSLARPGYGGSSRRPGRHVASIVSETALVLDTLGVERFAVAGASGGGPHALACGALLSGRVDPRPVGTTRATRPCGHDPPTAPPDISPQSCSASMCCTGPS